MSDQPIPPRPLHRFRSKRNNCRCLWCDQTRLGASFECPVSIEVRRAIGEFATKHGSRWKSKLSALWYSGKDSGLLRQARNIIGPSGLYRITDHMLVIVLPANI